MEFRLLDIDWHSHLLAILAFHAMVLGLEWDLDRCEQVYDPRFMNCKYLLTENSTRYSIFTLCTLNQYCFS